LEVKEKKGLKIVPCHEKRISIFKNNADLQYIRFSLFCDEGLKKYEHEQINLAD